MLSQYLMGSVVWECKAHLPLRISYFPALRLHCDQDRACEALWEWQSVLRGQPSGSSGCRTQCHAHESLQWFAYLEGFGHFPFRWRVTDVRIPRKKIKSHPISSSFSWMVLRRREWREEEGGNPFPMSWLFSEGYPLTLLLSALLLRPFGGKN